jgi:uncharacterized protein with FMN-binding domain
MRRSIPVLTATAGTLALLAGFHTTNGSAVVHASATGTTETTGTPETTPATSAAAGGPPTSSSPTTAGTTRTVDGPVVTNRYGDVQVRVTLRGKQIVDVQALTLPSDRSRSQEISQYAGPRLRAEVLQAQSAQIDLISGASYTSDSYAQSLQGALDRAG